MFHRVFRKAFSVAKHARKTTSTGCGPISIRTVMVTLAGKSFHTVSWKTVLIIGRARWLRSARAVSIECSYRADHQPELQRCRRIGTRTWRCRRSVREVDGSSKKGGSHVCGSRLSCTGASRSTYTTEIARDLLRRELRDEGRTTRISG